MTVVVGDASRGVGRPQGDAVLGILPVRRTVRMSGTLSHTVTCLLLLLILLFARAG